MSEYSIQYTPLEILVDNSGFVRFARWEATVTRGTYVGHTAGECVIPDNIMVAHASLLSNGDLAALLEEACGQILSNQIEQAHEELYADHLHNVNLTAVDLPEATAEHVDSERDRRIEAGFTYNGVRYQSRQADRENMMAAAIVAFEAIRNGAQPGDYRWKSPDVDAAWIAEDNTIIPLDAFTMRDLALTAMAHKEGLIFKARVLKDMPAIPRDYKNDSYWQ